MVLSHYNFKVLGYIQTVVGWPFTEFLKHLKWYFYHFTTPWNINMEAENHQFEKDHHLPNLHFFGSMLIFRGVYLFF